MIKEIQAKKILIRSKNPQSWFGVNYNMNIYRGCQHGCIYCDSRSECYGIDKFDEISVKINAIELLQKELSSKRKKGTIGTGAMSDPYIPLEEELELTKKALQIIVQFGYPLHICTKSDLILRDKELLIKINKIFASVAFTVTTCQDELAKKIEPYAPLPSKRLHAMKVLSEAGIYTGVLMMPILPFIEDNEENIKEIVRKAYENGAKFIIPSFGMTLRDRQRDYYYEKLDSMYQGISDKYRRYYGNNYSCGSLKYGKLRKLFINLCSNYGIVWQMNKIKKYDVLLNKQLELF